MVTDVKAEIGYTMDEMQTELDYVPIMIHKNLTVQGENKLQSVKEFLTYNKARFTVRNGVVFIMACDVLPPNHIQSRLIRVRPDPLEITQSVPEIEDDSQEYEYSVYYGERAHEKIPYAHLFFTRHQSQFVTYFANFRHVCFMFKCRGKKMDMIAIVPSTAYNFFRAAAKTFYFCGRPLMVN